MKKKELNTFVKEQLEQDNGIPFKEDYWNQMDTLLNANMPLVEEVPSSVVSGVKALKLLYVFFGALAVVGITYLSYHFYTHKTPNAVAAVGLNQEKTTQSVAVSPAEPIQKDLSSNHSAQSEKNNIRVESKAETFNELPVPNRIKSSIGINESRREVENNLTQSKTVESALLPVESNTILNSEQNASAESKVLQTHLVSSSEATTSFQQTELDGKQIIAFKTLSSLIPSLTLSPKTLSIKEVPLITYPRSSAIIKHLSITPVIGMMNWHARQSQENGNKVYTLPSQSALTYGIMIEAEAKRFGIRSGIAWSTHTFELLTKTNTNVYTVDTSYKIVNPNYGSTLSGKPVALVQRHLDTTAVINEISMNQQRNSYQLISIPITLQYRIPLKRFTLLLEGGALHHLRVSKQSNAPIQVSNSETSLQIPSYNFQFCAGGGLRYSINVNWSLGIQYNYVANPIKANLPLVNKGQWVYIGITRSIW